MRSNDQVSRRCVAVLCLVGIAAGQNTGDSPDRPLTAPEIISRMIEMNQARAAELREYVSLRRYFLENKRFHKTAEMNVQMTYRQPGSKHFTVLAESGPKIIQDRVLRRLMDSELEASVEPIRGKTQIVPENYSFRFIGLDSDRDRRAYLFEVSPKAPSKFMIKGRIWLDATDFAITRIEGSPAKNPSFLIRSTNFVHTYQKQGAFWLPETNVSHSESILLGQTSIEITYRDYRINQAE